MAYQTVFKRYELKYLMTEQQKKCILDAMEPYMQIDEYGRTTIRNLYYDTKTYQLVRNSIESPVYKEKLRVRSYSQAQNDSTVFVELKKKYQSVVYKRRLALPCQAAMNWINRKQPCPDNSQIAKEIEWFLDFYRTLRPAAFLSYEREAYYTKEPSDFRVTFDDSILCREKDISLLAPVWGTPLISENMVLMEIKCSGGIPLWMASALSENGIRKTSFSKYGTAYQSILFPKLNQNSKEVYFYVS